MFPRAVFFSRRPPCPASLLGRGGKTGDCSALARPPRCLCCVARFLMRNPVSVRWPPRRLFLLAHLPSSLPLLSYCSLSIPDLLRGLGPMTVSALSRGPSAFELSSRQEGHARHRRRSEERYTMDEGNGYPPFYTSYCSSFKETFPSLSLGFRLCFYDFCFVLI